MGDWPKSGEPWGIDGPRLISPPHPLCLGSALSLATQAAPASAAWPAANRAIFIPFRLPRLCIAKQMVLGTGTGTTGNFDVGIYDAFGNRLVSSGAIAHNAASSEMVANITDTAIGPGIYYMALAADGTSTYTCYSGSIAGCRALGILEMSTAYVLPNPATYATYTSSIIPTLGLWLTSQ